MTIIDAIITGTVLVVVTPVDGNKAQSDSTQVKLRVDLLSVNPSQASEAFGKVNSTLKKVSRDGFQLIQMTTNGKRNLKTIVRNAQIFRPYDFDKSSVTRLSAEFLNIPGVNAMTSAVITVDKTDTDDVLDLLTFTEVEADKYIIGDTGYSLKLRNDKEGNVSLTTDVNDLVQQGDFEIASVVKKHYGLVKLNATNEYYVMLSAEERMNVKSSSTAGGNKPQKPGLRNSVMSTPRVPNVIDEDQQNANKKAIFPSVLDGKSKTALGILATAFVGTALSSKSQSGTSLSDGNFRTGRTSADGDSVSLKFFNYDGQENDRFELEGESLTIEELRKIRSML